MKLKSKTALTAGAILIITMGFTALVQIRIFTAQVREDLQVKAKIIGRELSRDIMRGFESGLDLSKAGNLSPLCRDLVSENLDLSFAMVVDKEGVIRSHNDSSREKTPVDRTILDPSSPPAETLQVEVSAEGADIYATIIPLFDAGNDYRGAAVIGLREESITSRILDLTWPSVIAGVASIAVMLLLILLLVSAQITGPLGHLIRIAGKVAEGDLTEEIQSDSPDEIGDAHRAFGSMLGSLHKLQGRMAASFREMEKAVEDLTAHAGILQTVSDRQFRSVEEISSFIQHINRQAKDISGSMDNLSRSSEETSSSTLEMMASIEEVAQNSDTLSSSVNETSSSMEQVLVSNREVAQNIEHLNQLISQTSTAATQIDASIKEVQLLAQDSRQVAEEVRINAEKDGGSAVEETVLEMGEIREAVTTLSNSVSTLNTSVDNIGAILNVIDDVAEQTNLLALNAAIIAAQAGEHGRGFAVVAEEIRELAERTSSSTKEISKVVTGIQTETKKVGLLVRDGIGRVDRGSEAVGRTDQALKKIIVSSEKAVEMSTRIARATAEQASGSREMARSIQNVSERSSQISKSTTEQGRGSESIVMAIENMRDLAEQLRKATIEQTSGAKLIARAGEGATILASEVSKAVQEGSNLSEQAVKNVNSISSSTKETLEVVGKTNAIAQRFGTLAENLRKTLSQFRT